MRATVRDEADWSDGSSTAGDGHAASAAAKSPAPVTVIQPTPGWASLRLKELWQYRELLYFLVWRDIKVRYKQTALGVAWAVVQPLVTMLIFTIVFGRLAGLPSDGVPYPLFTFAALLPWIFFAGALARAGTSLVGSATLIRKVYFPRLIIPLAAVSAGVVDLGIAFVILLAMMAFFGVAPGLAVLTLPLFVLLALLAALGVALWLSALNVKYRDVGFLLPFIVQIWMYASPVAYGSSLIPEKWRWLYSLNPMTGVIEGFRWALFGTGQRPGGMIAISTAIVLLLLVSGSLYFRRVEKTFADVI